MDNSELFQKKALEKLRTPEGMDKLFSVIGHMDWLLLVAVALMFFSVAIWAVFGVMAEKVVGYGILIDSSGTVSISHPYGGQVTSVNLDVGDVVTEGQVVATLKNDDLMQKFLVSKEQINSSLSDIDMKERASEITSLKEQILRALQVTSPHSGVIIEKHINKGDVVGAGANLYTVMIDDNVDELIVIVYVNPLDGGKIEPGMDIQISPGPIDSSEYGSLLGKVIDVSKYPVSIDHPLSFTGNNQELANWFFQKSGGAAVAVTAQLIKDANTPTGYLWTSIMGPEGQVKPGVLCTGTAITKRQAPFDKAFKKFSQWVRND